MKIIDWWKKIVDLVICEYLRKEMIYCQWCQNLKRTWEARSFHGEEHLHQLSWQWYLSKRFGNLTEKGHSFLNFFLIHQRIKDNQIEHEKRKKKITWYWASWIKQDRWNVLMDIVQWISVFGEWYLKNRIEFVLKKKSSMKEMEESFVSNLDCCLLWNVSLKICISY